MSPHARAVLCSLLLCLVVPAWSFAPMALRLPLASRVARAPALCSLRAEGTRTVSRTEIIAIKRQSQGLQGQNLRSWLEGRGYSPAVQEEVARIIESGEDEQKGDSMWEKQIDEAEALEGKASEAEGKLKELKEQEAEAREKLQWQLQPRADALKRDLDAAEEAAQGWMAMFGAKGRLEAASKAYREVEEELGEATRAADGITSQIQVLESRIESVKKASKELRGTATRIRQAEEAQEQSRMLAACSAIVSAAERALEKEGAEAARKVLLEGKPDLDALGLKPDRRAGLTSLPGRLSTVQRGIDNPSSLSSSSSSSAKSGAGDEDMSRNAFVGLLAVAAAGAAAALYKPK